MKDTGAAETTPKKLTDDYLAEFAPVEDDIRTAVLTDERGDSYEIRVLPWRDGETRRAWRLQAEAHITASSAAPFTLPNGAEFRPDANTVQDADYLRFRVVDPAWSFLQWLQVFKTNIGLWNAVWGALDEVDGLAERVEAAKNDSSAAPIETNMGSSDTGTPASGADSQ